MEKLIVSNLGGKCSLITIDEWPIINDIILEIYRGKSTLEIRKMLLEKMPKLIDYKTASFMLGTIKDGIIYFFDGVTNNLDINYSTYSQYQHQDPMNPFYFQEKESVCIESEYVTRSMAEKLPLYTEGYWPNGLYYMLGARVGCNGILLGSLVFARPKEETDFDEHDKQILRVITEHITARFYALHPEGFNEYDINPASDTSTMLGRKYGLSLREDEIARMICKGFTANEIAGQLYISESTVKHHSASIFKKTGVNKKAQLINLVNSIENKQTI